MMMNQMYSLLSKSCIMLIAADALTNSVALHQVLSGLGKKTRLYMLLKESIYSLASMFLLYFALKLLLFILQTPSHAIQVAAGIGVSTAGLRAVLRKTSTENWTILSSTTGLPRIVPITLPIILGPSWLSACGTLISNQTPLSSVAIILAMSWILITSVTLGLQIGLYKQEKARVLLSIQTVFGFLTTILGTQILISGLQKTFL